ncbi:MAG: LysE family transporter [Rhodospirillales bacterium]|nr:MAG: LysE family transporter [Rhodospirillales bacterium]
MESSLVWALAGFAVVHLLAVASPGPTFLFMARAAAARGRGPALLAATATGFGAVFWAAAALFGLQLLIAGAGWLYGALRLAGAAYLLWIAFHMIRHATDPLAAAGDIGGGGLPALWLRAFLVQLSNPKVMVFFGSVFATLLPAQPPLVASLLALAIVYLNEFGWYALVALLFSTPRIGRAYRAGKAWIERAAGGVIGAMGLKLAFDR